MKKVKKVCAKLLVVILICVMICPASGIENVRAASLSKDDAFEVYIYVLRKWLEQGVYVTVNNDISNYVTDTRKRPTERIPLRTIFDEEEGYSTIEDLNGDGIPECVIGTGVGKPGYMLVLTIYKNSIVRLLSVFKTTGRGTPTIYYNKSKNTFAIVQLTSARTRARHIYRIQNGKLSRVTTIADSVGQMLGNGKIPMLYYVNGRKVSKATYMKRYNAYVKYAKQSEMIIT